MDISNMTIFLLTMCICIESWHIIYYMLLYEKYFKQFDTSIKWIQSYEKMYNHFIEFTDYYINNLKLQYSLGINTTSKEMLLIIQLIKSLGTPLECRRKILSPYSTRLIFNRFVILFVDIIYNCILFILLWFFLSGPTGLAVIGVLVTMNMIRRGLESANEDSKPIFFLSIKSIICIFMFIVITLNF